MKKNRNNFKFFSTIFIINMRWKTLKVPNTIDKLCNLIIWRFLHCAELQLITTMLRKGWG